MDITTVAACSTWSSATCVCMCVCGAFWSESDASDSDSDDHLALWVTEIHFPKILRTHGLLIIVACGMWFIYRVDGFMAAMFASHVTPWSDHRRRRRSPLKMMFVGVVHFHRSYIFSCIYSGCLVDCNTWKYKDD